MTDITKVCMSFQNILSLCSYLIELVFIHTFNNFEISNFTKLDIESHKIS